MRGFVKMIVESEVPEWETPTEHFTNVATRVENGPVPGGTSLIDVEVVDYDEDPDALTERAQKRKADW